jgi:hypothetical protein
MMTNIEAGLRSCQKCGKAFEPRSGSGGSLKRFCCTGCRLDFHKKRQRSERRGMYAGPTPSCPGGQPAGSEKLSRPPAVAALGPWETGVLDIAGCDRTDSGIRLSDHKRWARTNEWAKFLAADAAEYRRK